MKYKRALMEDIHPEPCRLAPSSGQEENNESRALDKPGPS